MPHRVALGVCSAPSPQRSRWPWLSAVIACFLAAACVEGRDPSTPADGVGSRVAIAIAPLSLSGVTDASWRLTVSAGPDTVWTRDVTSGGFGAGAGSLSYVGPCDAAAGQNTVTVELFALYQGATGDTLVDAGTYRNPGPLTRSVTCDANADVAVPFDVTIARAANQGFFDVAVAFDDVFCSAKLDCQRPDGGPIALLFDDAGVRRPTVVLAFACTADTAADDTVLYLDDVTVTCAGGAASVDPSAGPGVLAADAFSQPAGAPILFGAAVYRGHEQLGGAGKLYWNLALGLELGTAAAQGCTLSATGTAASGPLADDTTPEGATYPLIRWTVPLTSAAAALTCTHHPLDGGNGVAVDYASPDARETFDHSFDGGAVTTTPPDDPPVIASAQPSCAHILAADPDAVDGPYTLDPDGPGAAPEHEAWCDMTTDGGGWTLVHAKTSGAFLPTVGTVDLNCATTLSGDCASAIDPRLAWSSVLWRFGDATSPLVTWQRAFSDAPGGVASYLLGYGTVGEGVAVGGFERFVDGAWSGQGTINALHYGPNPTLPPNNGFSESHGGGSDRWIDLWNVADASNNYLFTENDDAALRGRKCLAGHCRAAPVHMLVRDAAVCGAACGHPVYPRSCAALLGDDPDATSDLYTIDPDGPGGRPPYDVWCDMTTDGGGWTLVATKVEPAFVSRSASFASACGASTGASCASAIAPDLRWTEVLWRFAADTDQRVRWARDPASTFSRYLLGEAVSGSGVPLAGVSRTVNGVTSGHTIGAFYFTAADNYSEGHSPGTDQWLDMWREADPTNGYTVTEGGNAALRGTKCLAGYCRASPIWLMVRDAAECGPACGQPAVTAPSSCAAILAADPTAPSGPYTIDPARGGAATAYTAWCDMTTDGGGWTLVKTKVTPGYNTWSAAFDPACGASTAADCRSAVHAGLDYADVLWRFADSDGILVRWASRTHDGLRAWLGGDGTAGVGGTRVVGFSKTVDGVYTGPHTMASLHFTVPNDFAESHANSDRWIDLWTIVDNNAAPQGYIDIEGGDTTLRGRKCLAGYCRTAPVWMLVR